MKIKRNTFNQAFVFSVILLLGIIVMSSFQNDDSKAEKPDAISQLVQEEIDKKLAKFKKNIIDKCTRNALKNAEIFIDSIVAEELKLQRNDTIAFPSKPVRPSLPKKIILNDSTGIDPILDN